MVKKLVNYLGFLVMLCSIFIAPIDVFAEVNVVGSNGEQHTNQSNIDYEPKNQITLNNIVTNEQELLQQIENSSTSGAVTTIIIQGNIKVTNTLVIGEGKNIILKSSENESGGLQHVGNNDSALINIIGGKLTLGEHVNELYELKMDGNNNCSGGLIETSISNKGTIGELIVNSGLITGTSGTGRTGGGILNQGKFTMNGGQISGNRAYSHSWSNGGGGIYTSGEFIMNGGVIENNSCRPEGKLDGGFGGGILVMAGSAEINAGTIRKNQATAGGGIYVYGASHEDLAELAIVNGLIHENSANVRGGGVWFCQSGVLYSSKLNPSLAIGNQVQRDTEIYKTSGDDYFSEAKAEYIHSIGNFLAKTVNGENLIYYRDDESNRYALNNQIIENFESINSEQELALHVGLDNINIDKLIDSSKVLISNNFADDGGGLAVNGKLVLGNKETKFDPVSIMLKAEKVLEGRVLAAEEFSFELRDSDGNIIQTKTNDSEGTISFDKLTYEKAGVYEYTIKEVNDKKTGITYDEHNIKVTVTVEEIAGKLVAKANYIGSQIFNNKYTAEHVAKKNDTVKKRYDTNSFSSDTSSGNSGKKMPKTGEVKLERLRMTGFLLLISISTFLIYKRYS